MKTTSTRTTCCDMAPSGCSSHAHTPRSHGTYPTVDWRRRRRPSAAASTACRSPSSSPLRASPRSASKASRRGSTIASGSSQAAAARRCRANKRCARRSAAYQRNLCERAQAEWETQPTAEWLAAYGRELDNLRAALDWAFAPDGDTAIGVALTSAAVPLWFQLSLLDECRARVERALS